MSADWYYMSLLQWEGGSWVPVMQEWLPTSNCAGSKCSTTSWFTLQPGRYGWWLRPWSALTGYRPWIGTDFFVDSNLPNSRQAILDAAKRARKDRRFEPLLVERIGDVPDWDPFWELRWIDFRFVGGRMVTIWQATSRTDPAVRFCVHRSPTSLALLNSRLN